MPAPVPEAMNAKEQEGYIKERSEVRTCHRFELVQRSTSMFVVFVLSNLLSYYVFFVSKYTD